MKNFFLIILSINLVLIIGCSTESNYEEVIEKSNLSEDTEKIVRALDVHPFGIYDFSLKNESSLHFNIDKYKDGDLIQNNGGKNDITFSADDSGKILFSLDTDNEMLKIALISDNDISRSKFKVSLPDDYVGKHYIPLNDKKELSENDDHYIAGLILSQNGQISGELIDSEESRQKLIDNNDNVYLLNFHIQSK